jgi:hypothetical protein
MKKDIYYNIERQYRQKQVEPKPTYFEIKRYFKAYDYLIGFDGEKQVYFKACDIGFKTYKSLDGLIEAYNIHKMIMKQSKAKQA